MISTAALALFVLSGVECRPLAFSRRSVSRIGPVRTRSATVTSATGASAEQRFWDVSPVLFARGGEVQLVSHSTSSL